MNRVQKQNLCFTKDEHVHKHTKINTLSGIVEENRFHFQHKYKFACI